MYSPAVHFFGAQRKKLRRARRKTITKTFGCINKTFSCINKTFVFTTKTFSYSFPQAGGKNMAGGGAEVRCDDLCFFNVIDDFLCAYQVKFVT